MSRAELEAAIRANRDDAAAYDVYADWLIAHGDPHGELIALERKGDPSLYPRIFELRDALVRWPDDADVGDYAFEADFATTWRWGLWDRVAISCSSGMTDGYYDTPALAQFAFAHPACVALRVLRFDLYDWRFASPADVPPVLAAAEGHAWARELHTLHAGEIDTSGPPQGGAQLGRCSGAISRIFPGLRVLALLGEEIELAELALPRLTALHVFTPELTDVQLAELYAAKLPALEHVELDTADLAPAAVAAIATGVFPKLRMLSVRSDAVVDELAHALASSPVAARLEHLELRLSDDAARALDAATLPRLRSLILAGIDKETRAQLVNRFPRAHVNARD